MVFTSRKDFVTQLAIAEVERVVANTAKAHGVAITPDLRAAVWDATTNRAASFVLSVKKLNPQDPQFNQ